MLQLKEKVLYCLPAKIRCGHVDSSQRVRLPTKADASSPSLLSLFFPALHLTSRPVLSKPWKPLSALLSKSKIMELVNWSLNAIDRIFSTRSPGSGEPVCPGGTYAAGYMRDSWEQWRVVCLAILSVEDIEDLYIFGTVISGFLLIGLGIALVYRKIRKTVTAVQIPTLPEIIDGVSKAVSTQTVNVNRNLGTTLEGAVNAQTVVINRNMGHILEKLAALKRRMDGDDQNGLTDTSLGQGRCWNNSPTRSLQ